MSVFSGRAAKLLACLENPDAIFYSSGSYTVRLKDDLDEDGWFRLTIIPNLGPKTVAELVAAGLIIRHPYMRGYYRLVQPLPDDTGDFGDLWVA